MDVVVMAAIVPMGIDFWASRRSPDRLEPAMIPEGGWESVRVCQNHKSCERSVALLSPRSYENIPQAVLTTEITEWSPSSIIQVIN